MTNDIPAARTVRAAVVQAAPVLFDTPQTLEKLADLTADAARQRAELVVFPEAFVGGYPKGHDFGVSLGIRTPEGRDEFRRLFESAIEVPGPATEYRVGRQGPRRPSRRRRDRAGRRDAVLHGADLRARRPLLGKHRKLMPTAMERVIWGSGDGSTLPVVATPLGKIGSVICWENYMPLLRTAMYAKGVELYCAITVDDRETWVPTVRHIALEGRCFVLSACQFLRRADLPPGYPTGRFPADQDVLIRGGSCIVGPLGQLLAGPVYGEECVLTADLDRADLARAKFDFDVVGHYARPDVFRLNVNERPDEAGGVHDRSRTKTRVGITPAHAARSGRGFRRLQVAMPGRRSRPGRRRGTCSTSPGRPMSYRWCAGMKWSQRECIARAAGGACGWPGRCRSRSSGCWPR